MICPFCMNEHNQTEEECPEKGLRIPKSYLTSNNPVNFVFTIGYSGHGKTCYLSSLFHTFYHGSYSQKWPGFSFLGLTQDTLNKIHNEYVHPLSQGNLPPKTPIMFPTPLILKLQNAPLKKGPLSLRVKQKEIIIIFYDIGGGTFEVAEKIEENLPLLSKIRTLVFLIDLPGLIEDETEGKPDVVKRLHNLMNTIYLALENINQKNKKDLIICFSKADIMWKRKDLYGALAMKRKNSLPSIREIPKYMIEMKNFSENIHRYISERYNPFYAVLKNNFRKIYFTTFSALGKAPTDDNQIKALTPRNVLDPIFWTMRLNKCL